MKLEDVRPFERLDPPPGGIERFREQIERHAEPAMIPAPWLWATGLTVSFAVIAVVAVLRSTGDPAQPLSADPEPALTSDTESPARDLYQAQQFDRLLGRPMQPAKLSVAINEESVDVAEIPSANARVRLYQIQTN